MDWWGEVIVGVVIAVSILMVVFPVLPALPIELAAIGVWAYVTGGSVAWTVFGIAAVIVAAGTVVKFTKPGREMKRAGIPNSTLLLGVLLGVIGVFVIPIVGLFVGFVLGVFLAEVRRLGQTAAWPSTKTALKAVVQSIAIEFLAGLLAAGVWIGGLIAT